MGAVYLARDLRLDRLVALKVLPPEIALDTALRERFLRETRTAASFSHPNIVPVHAIEEHEGFLAFAMGYVEGESLTERVRRAGPLDLRGTVRLLQDVGYALAYAHGRGIVHRDIKPDNIMIERATGRALLMDFGISRTITSSVETPGLTRIGEVVGTPEYMSPEQATGGMVDGRSDIYSLGLVALFAISGTTAITGDSTQRILARQLTEMPLSAATLRPDLPGALARTIDKCVAKDPGERFATAELLIEAIDDARLTAAEVPIPIRLFAQEAGTLGLIVVFLTIIGFLLVDSRSQLSLVDALLPTTILFAVVLTRFVQTLSEARTLAAAGYAPQDIIAGLRMLLEERKAVRVARRADGALRRRRRISLLLAALYIPLGLVLIRVAFGMRVPVGPGMYEVSIGVVAMVFTGFILLGVSFVLFLRSPFRATPGERLFRLVWLGPPGRLFFRIAARGVGAKSAS